MISPVAWQTTWYLVSDCACWKPACTFEVIHHGGSRVKLRHHPALPKMYTFPEDYPRRGAMTVSAEVGQLLFSCSKPKSFPDAPLLPSLCSHLVGFKLHEKIWRSSPGGAQSKLWSGPNSRASSAGGRIIPCHDQWPWCQGQAVCALEGSSPHNTLNQPVFPHI